MAGVQGEILAAKRLHTDYGEAMLADPELAPLIERYRGAFLNTRAIMEQEGIFTACAACAARVEGGCCFCGVEEWYDSMLLLINLLLGTQIPLSGNLAEGCLFVGPGGCRLTAKHSFCLNYLCPALKSGLQAGAETRLLAVIGEELLRGWDLERGIRTWLSRRSSPHAEPLTTPFAGVS
ncbi:MAG: hypothetical protein AB1512_10540 [Thermodesulfobacteriota bacterium]